MNESTTLWDLVHAIWDGVGFGMIAAIAVGLVVANVVMICERFSKTTKND